MYSKSANSSCWRVLHGPWRLISFGLDLPDGRFGEDVVERVADAADRGDRADGDQGVGVADR
jgi:hypothetical protein